MKRRVIITKLPTAGSGFEVKMDGLRAGLGFNANQMPWPVMAGKMSAPDVRVNSTLQPVPRDEANLEAEKGEVAMTPGKGGIPDAFKIGGKRHSQGGTPLNLPPDSFIYSDTPKMRIKDETMLKQFGMAFRKGGYTPAEIAKKYDINNFKKILANNDVDDIQKDTAELMISNYNLKLAKLALLQESMKGFPQGLPQVAMPYIEEMQIDPAQFVQMNPGQGDDSSMAEGDNMTAQFGGGMEMRNNQYQTGGPLKGYNGPVTNYPIPGQIDPNLANTHYQPNTTTSGDFNLTPFTKYIEEGYPDAPGWIGPVLDMGLAGSAAGAVKPVAKGVAKLAGKIDWPYVGNTLAKVAPWVGENVIIPVGNAVGKVAGKMAVNPMTYGMAVEGAVQYYNHNQKQEEENKKLIEKRLQDLKAKEAAATKAAIAKAVAAKAAADKANALAKSKVVATRNWSVD